MITGGYVVVRGGVKHGIALESRQMKVLKVAHSAGEGGAPTGMTYATVTDQSSNLANSRRLVAGSNITLTDTGAGGTLTIASSSSISANDSFARKLAMGALVMGRR